MAFPTIPTAGAGRLLSAVQADTSGTRTFPSLSGLTKNSGDLLIAIIIGYQSTATANAVYSAWGGGFTEFHDSSSSTTMCLGAAWKISTGSETGTFTVTQAATITGHVAMFLLSIPGAALHTPPEAGSRADGVPADPASFNPSGWDTEDTLWIAVGASGETGTGGSYTGIASGPANYTDYAESGISADAVGGVEGAVAFRQLNAASEDVGTFSVDTSNARGAAFVIAVRPALIAPSADATASAPIPVPEVRVSPDASTATGSAPTPSLEVRAAPDSAIGTADAPVPTPEVRVVTDAGIATATGLIPVIDIQAGGTTVVDTDGAEAAASAPVPTVVERLEPGAQEATVSAPTPTLVELLEPAAGTATASGPTPVLALMIPSEIGIATLSAPIPTLLETIGPDAATATMSAPIPTIDDGSGPVYPSTDVTMRGI